MARAKTAEVRSFVQKHRKKRPGVHSKKGSSKCKRSKHYLKVNVGQGK